jgi:hypothetical protein
MHTTKLIQVHALVVVFFFLFSLFLSYQAKVKMHLRKKMQEISPPVMKSLKNNVMRLLECQGTTRKLNFTGEFRL